MKVKPWTTVEETLDALHDLLAARRDDAEFWKGLGELLAQLEADMERRAGRGGFAGNEVLDPGRVAALVEELRAAATRNEAGGGFRRLARGLSAPAIGLLMLLAGAATAGCEHDQSIAGDASADSAVVDAAADTTTVDAPDAPEPRVDPGCVNEGLTFDEIVAECVADAETRERVLACVDALHSSWRTGLREHFECMSCHDVSEDIGLCLLYPWGGSTCEAPEDVGEFDLEAFLDNCAALIYLGVRFE
jgi:hypothetical protein